MELKVGVLTVSDRCFEKQATDESGPVVESLINNNTTLFKHFNSIKIEKDIVPDEAELISNKLIEWSDKQQYHLILTTGGTSKNNLIILLIRNVKYRYSDLDQAPDLLRETSLQRPQKPFYIKKHLA
jgi:hypothetical protein